MDTVKAAYLEDGEGDSDDVRDSLRYLDTDVIGLEVGDEVTHWMIPIAGAVTRCSREAALYLDTLVYPNLRDPVLRLQLGKGLGHSVYARDTAGKYRPLASNRPTVYSQS